MAEPRPSEKRLMQQWVPGAWLLGYWSPAPADGWLTLTESQWLNLSVEDWRLLPIGYVQYEQDWVSLTDEQWRTLSESEWQELPIFAQPTEGRAFPVRVYDLLLSIPDASSLSNPTIFLRSFTVDLANEPSLILVNLTNELVFNTDHATKIHDTTWEGLRSIQWEYPDWDRRSLTMVFYRDDLIAFQGQSQGDLYNVFPPNSVRFWPKIVESIKVDSSGPLNGDIRIQSGYNIQQDTDTSTFASAEEILPPQILTINASEGQGMGLEPTDCQSDEDATAIRQINGVPADDYGDFHLDHGDCYRVTPITDGVQIENDCETCVRCEDFDNLYMRLQQLHLRATNLAATINENKDKIVEQIEAVQTLAQETGNVSSGLEIVRTGENSFEMAFQLRTGGRVFERVYLYAEIYNVERESINSEWYRVAKPDPPVGDFSIGNYQLYTGRKKLPGQVAVEQKYFTINETIGGFPATILVGNPAKGFTVTGGYVEDHKFREQTFAGWQFAVVFDREIVISDKWKETKEINWYIRAEPDVEDPLGTVYENSGVEIQEIERKFD